jgi:hypothetical protein
MALVEMQAGPFLVTAAITRDSVEELGLAAGITHHGKTINITTQRPVSCPIPEIAAGDAPRQPPGRSPARRGTPG